MFDLKGRVALITGAGQGVGAAVAQGLAELGAAVAVNDLDQGRARTTVDAVAGRGGAACAAVADVTDAGSVARMVADVESQLGPVDITVNNAGLPATGVNLKPFLEMTTDDWEPWIKLNLYGVLYVTHATLGGMVERGWGRVITVVSDAGRVGEPYQTVYSAAKAGAAGFSRSLAKEVGRAGVTCNCVSLSSIVHPGLPSDEERRAKAAKLYPMRRLGEPADVVGAVAWLASDEAAWVTAQTVGVNGGYAPS
jgi:2-hydroxycyclohexanecarboxyl-CoA dehydrogenase